MVHQGSRAGAFRRASYVGARLSSGVKNIPMPLIFSADNRRRIIQHWTLDWTQPSHDRRPLLLGAGVTWSRCHSPHWWCGVCVTDKEAESGRWGGLIKQIGEDSLVQ